MLTVETPKIYLHAPNIPPPSAGPAIIALGRQAANIAWKLVICIYNSINTWGEDFVPLLTEIAWAENYDNMQKKSRKELVYIQSANDSIYSVDTVFRE